MQRKKGVCFVVSFLVVLLLISVVSAGFLDSLFKKTGKASSQPQDVSVTVTGLPPNIIFVEDINGGSAVNPIESNNVAVVFEVRVSDPNGVDNLDDSSVSADFDLIGEVTRSGSCTWQSDFDATTAIYSCSVNMEYYAGAGTWTVTVYASDLDANSDTDTSETFDYAILRAMTISPATIGFGSVATLATNQEATDDPTIVTNTGNYDGVISIQAYNLYGLTDNTENIPAANFVADIETGAGVECSGGANTETALVDTISTPITGTDSNPGVGGTEELYYCLTLVPNVQSQSYSTTEGTFGNPWVILY